MKRFSRTAVIAAIVLFAGLVFAANRSVTGSGICTTEAQVIEHADRSRNGISLTCNEDVLRNSRERLGANQH